MDYKKTLLKARRVSSGKEKALAFANESKYAWIQKLFLLKSRALRTVSSQCSYYSASVTVINHYW